MIRKLAYKWFLTTGFNLGGAVVVLPPPLTLVFTPLNLHTRTYICKKDHIMNDSTISTLFGIILDIAIEMCIVQINSIVYKEMDWMVVKWCLIHKYCQLGKVLLIIMKKHCFTAVILSLLINVKMNLAIMTILVLKCLYIYIYIYIYRMWLSNTFILM